MDATRQQGEDISIKSRPGSMRVLVANEPLAYREVVSAAIEELRPYIEAITTEPTNLDEEFLRFTPGFVVCSQTTPLIEQEAPAWIELYPKHTSRAVVSLSRERIVFEDMDFNTLLFILDEAQHLYKLV